MDLRSTFSASSASLYAIWNEKFNWQFVGTQYYAWNAV